MAKEKKEAFSKVLTPTFRASFVNVFEPSAFDDDDEAKYSITMLFDKEADLSKLKALAKEAAAKKWPQGVPKNLRSPFRDGAEKPDFDGYEGMIFVIAKSKDKPGVVDQKVEPIVDQSEFYSGCFARATVTAYGYDYKGNKGVAFGLVNVQKVKDGEPFSSRSKPSDDFEPLEVGDSGTTGDVDDLF